MKKILSVVLALVMVLALGVTAFAADKYYDGYAGGYYNDEEDQHYMNWVWDVFETTKTKYCRIAVDFRYKDDVDIYVDPNAVLNEYLKTNGVDYWDWDNSSKDSFELFAEGPFTYTVKEVTMDDTNVTNIVETPYQLLYNGAYYNLYTLTAPKTGANANASVGAGLYIYAKLGDHNTKLYYPVATGLTDTTNLDGVDAIGIHAFSDKTVKTPINNKDKFAGYKVVELTDAGEAALLKIVKDPETKLVIDPDNKKNTLAYDYTDMKGQINDHPQDIDEDNWDEWYGVYENVTVTNVSYYTTNSANDFYRIRIVPVDDYGVKVVRGSIYFKMIDYTSGVTSKFTSAPLYIDFYHTDVFDDDVSDIAGEKKALVLDLGLPYDNEFDCGKHDHEGGYTFTDKTLIKLFRDGTYDYDAVYGYVDQTPDVISAEHFDEGVGKTLKITDVDYTWRLEIAKVAEYQPGVNFTFNTTIADVIKGAFPDAKFQAVNFLTPSDGVIYKSGSTLYIKCDAKALGQKGESVVYAYKYVGGALEYQDAFNVNYYNNDSQYVGIELAAGESLGSYYLSNTDLRGTTDTTKDTTKDDTNPNTGANDVVGVAVALAVVSLVSAAAVSLKK